MGARIAAVGMVTALGLDWETSCAASRAGILRACVLDHFPFQTEEIGDPQFAKGHQVELLAKGFEGFGRLARLLAGAMRDLHSRVAEFPEVLRASGVYLSLPDPARNRQPDESPDMEKADVPPSPRDLAVRLVTQASRFARWSHAPKLEALSLAGHAGFAQVLHQAVADLNSGKTAACIVGGVDSLLDEDTLTWLLRSDRLKHPAHAAGLMPGEGAAIFLLTGRANSLPEICSIESVNLGEDSKTLMEDKTSDGGGLWRTVRNLQSWASLRSSPEPLRLSFTSDHNGEVYRARELGGFLVRCGGQIKMDSELPVSLPAISFGDTAAASGALGAAVAARSMARGYTRSDHNIVLSTSDGSQRGAILLRRADNGR